MKRFINEFTVAMLTLAVSLSESGPLSAGDRAPKPPVPPPRKAPATVHTVQVVKKQQVTKKHVPATQPSLATRRAGTNRRSPSTLAGASPQRALPGGLKIPPKGTPIHYSTKDFVAKPAHSPQTETFPRPPMAAGTKSQIPDPKVPRRLAGNGQIGVPSEIERLLDSPKKGPFPSPAMAAGTKSQIPDPKLPRMLAGKGQSGVPSANPRLDKDLANRNKSLIDPGQLTKLNDLGQKTLLEGETRQSLIAGRKNGDATGLGSQSAINDFLNSVQPDVGAPDTASLTADDSGRSHSPGLSAENNDPTLGGLDAAAMQQLLDGYRYSKGDRRSQSSEEPKPTGNSSNGKSGFRQLLKDCGFGDFTEEDAVDIAIDVAKEPVDKVPPIIDTLFNLPEYVGKVTGRAADFLDGVAAGFEVGGAERRVAEATTGNDTAEKKKKAEEEAKKKKNPNPDGADPLDPQTQATLDQAMRLIGKENRAARLTLGQMLSQPGLTGETIRIDRSQLNGPSAVRAARIGQVSNPGSEGSTGGTAEPSHSAPVKPRSPVADPPKPSPDGTPPSRNGSGPSPSR